MIKRITGKWFFFSLISVLISMVCTEYPNPFLDQSLSKATIESKTFQNGDTVLIFSSETISVVTYLREHIKEVSVHIDNNRFWKSSDTVFHEEDLSPDPIIIPISFYRTGWNKIEITTTYKNDQTTIEVDSLYARSPLAQQQITAMVGDSIHLKTEPVKDNSILYVWDFRDGFVVKEYTPQYDFVLKSSLSSLVGELYVVDPNNVRSLPPFYFSTTTGSKLNIMVVNGLMQGDTIYTGESNFTLKVYINGSFKSAIINNLSFDNVQASGIGFQVSKSFSKLDTLTKPMTINVDVTDKNGASTVKTFYLKFDVNQTNLPVISVTAPNVIRDTSIVMDSVLHMYGKVTGHAQYENLYIKFSLNGFAKGSYKLLPANNDWTYKLNLSYGWSKLKLDLSKDSTGSGAAIVSKEIQIKYDSTINDILPPKIRDIKIGGIAIAGDNSFTTSDSSTILTMVVSDNQGTKSVIVNNDSARVQQDGLTYSVSITPKHKIGGTQYIITATDLSNNVRSDTITGTLNHSPRIESVSLSSNMRIDSTYIFIIKASDGDADDKITKTIIVKRPSGDSTLTLINDTALWNPVLGDTGKNSIYIRVTDDFLGYDETTMVSTVYQKTDKPLKVSWLTNADDFPDSIIVGQDKLTGQLKINPNTGTGPFTYTVSIYNPSKVIYEGSDPQFSWTPTRSDAGVRTLRFIVKDKNNDCDTLDLLMNIIARPSAIVSFSDQSMIINENSTNAAAVVRLSTILPDSVKVPYTINFKSATPQDLNMLSSGIVSFAPGDTIVQLPINIVNDNQTEPDELFTIELSDLPALSDKDSIAINKSKSSVEVTIRDDDQRTVKYSFYGSASSRSEKANADTIKVVLDTTLDRDLEITYSYDKATSTANDSDFSFASTDHILKFKAGTKEASFIILITNDTKPEKDEVITFKLQSSDPAAIPGTNTTYEYTIMDDDTVTKVGVMLQPPTIPLPEGATPGFGIVLTGTLKNDITVTIRAKEASTARAGFDYTISSNRIVVKAGTTSQSMGLIVIKDNIPEPEKFVEFEIIAISDMVNAEISATAKTMRVTITDK
jgi:hypothetical protein